MRVRSTCCRNARVCDAPEGMTKSRNEVCASLVGTNVNVGRSRNLVLMAMIFAVSMTFIDQTIVATAAPQIQREVGLTNTGMQWAIDAYLLSLASLFAFGGRLADTVGACRSSSRDWVGSVAPVGASGPLTEAGRNCLMSVGLSVASGTGTNSRPAKPWLRR